MKLKICAGLLSFALCAPVFADAPGNASAHGGSDAHVRELSNHLAEYEAEIKWLLDKAQALIQVYADKGSKGVNTDELIDNFEAVKVHLAIELNYVPIYAEVWQGIYGMKQAMEEGKPAAEAEAQRMAFAKALWQGMGVVKLAAQHQLAQPAPSTSTDEAAQSPTATLEEIADTLDDVLALYRKGEIEKAKSLVHATYLNRFEGVEGALIEQDADLVEDLEKDFNVTLLKALQSGYRGIFLQAQTEPIGRRRPDQGRTPHDHILNSECRLFQAGQT